MASESVIDASDLFQHSVETRLRGFSPRVEIVDSRNFPQSGNNLGISERKDVYRQL